VPDVAIAGTPAEEGAGKGEGPGTEQLPASPAAEEPVPGDEVPAPANAVDWPTRGGVLADLYEQALTDFSRPPA
jgi:hypothetical protein